MHASKINSTLQIKRNKQRLKVQKNTKAIFFLYCDGKVLLKQFFNFNHLQDLKCRYSNLNYVEHRQTYKGSSFYPTISDNYCPLAYIKRSRYVGRPNSRWKWRREETDHIGQVKQLPAEKDTEHKVFNSPLRLLFKSVFLDKY
jgi:hypothetical protein